MATIAKERTVRRRDPAYRELTGLFEFFAEFEIVIFDDQTVDEFDSLRSAKLRLGTMDLKIAATTLTAQALLLSANHSDFERVPGLRVENWPD